MAPRRRPAAVLARERAAAEAVQPEVVVVGRQQRGEIVGLPGGRVALQDRRDLHALVVLRAGGGRDGRDRCARSQELAARDRRVPDVTVRAAAAAALSETGYGHLAEARKRRKSSLSTPKMVQGVGRKQHGPVTLVAGPRPPGVARHLERTVHPGAQDGHGAAMRAQAEGRAQVEGARTPEEERHGGSLIFRLSYGRASRRRRPWTTVDVVTFSRA
jgi:hypothetical protein